MSVLDLSPAPGGAPVARRVLRHGFMETRLLVRNGEQLLLALVIPLGILVGGRLLPAEFGRPPTLSPSVLAMAIWSSAFTSVAIATGFERRYGVLERLATTPLGRSGLVAGKSLAVGAVVFGQLVVLSATAGLLGWRPLLSGSAVTAAAVTGVLATATFTALALLLASVFRAEVTLGLANLFFLLLLAGGALLVPLPAYPAAVQPILRLLPTAALGEEFRAAAIGQALLWPLFVLAAWLVVSTLLVRKYFRWTS